MSKLKLDNNWSAAEASSAQAFCRKFIQLSDRPKYIYGRNVYAESVAKKVDITGFIDDFCDEALYLNKPILKLEGVPTDALVLAVSGGRPLSVSSKLRSLGLEHLDYFAFLRFSGLDILDVVFNESFGEIFGANEEKAAKLFDRFEDDLSREIFRKIFDFRSGLNLSRLSGFVDRQSEQYFEPFLSLPEGCVFWDVGGYDGFTTLEFIRRFPAYGSVQIFEPDPNNVEVCKHIAESVPNVIVWPYGAGKQNKTLRFKSNGSGSAISEDGPIVIEVRRLDDIGADRPTFIKMDIEGAELEALDGARRTITEGRPILAVAVYHRPSDFWEVPNLVLEMCPEYKVYLRHYTESIYESVMYFVP